LKDLYDNRPDFVLSCIKELLQENDNVKTQLVNVWKRNIYFTNGIQNMTSGGSFVIDNGTTQTVNHGGGNRKNTYNTNEIYQIVRTLVSYMTRARPAVDVFSANKSENSKLSAQMVNKVFEAKYDLDDELENSRVAAYWGLTTGTVFRKDYFDYSLGYEVQLPQYDELGNPVIDPETGEPVIDSQMSGNNSVAIKTGFNVGFDFLASTFDDTGFIHESYLADVEWIREAFDQEKEGFTGRASSVVADGKIGLSLLSLEELKTAAPGTRTMGTSMFSNREKAMVTEFFVKPNRDYPEGRLLILAGEQLVYDSVSPYCFKNMQGIWHPYTPWVFEPFIGRLFGKSLVEDLISSQMRLNEINGAILENANTLAKTDVLVSELAKMKQGVFAGGGSRVYSWSGLGPEPKKWAGVALPEQFFKERQELLDGMVRRAGTNFVMSGNPPPGVTAGAALELLLQNATSQQSDTMTAWEKFHEKAYSRKINVIKKFSQYPDDNIRNYLLSLTGDALNEEIDAFIGSDIADGVTIKIESGSMIPKMEKFKRDTMMTLLKEGALGPVQEDSPRGAVLREKIQKEMGVFGFDLEDSKDVEKAKWENERITRKEMPDPQLYDNHQIHIYVLLTLMKDPLFIERGDQMAKGIAAEHLAWHQEQVAMAQMQEQQAQMDAQMQQMGAEAQMKQMHAPAQDQPDMGAERPATTSLQ